MKPTPLTMIKKLKSRLFNKAPASDETGAPQDSWGWEVWHRYWVEQRLAYYRAIGLPDADLKLTSQVGDELAHYARACVDIEYAFPFGVQELEGIAARSDFESGLSGV